MLIIVWRWCKKIKKKIALLHALVYVVLCSVPLDSAEDLQRNTVKCGIIIRSGIFCDINLRAYSNHPSKCYSFIPQWGRKVTGAYLRCLQAVGGERPRLGRQLFRLREQKQQFTLTFIPKANFKLPIHLSPNGCLWAVGGSQSTQTKLRKMGWRHGNYTEKCPKTRFLCIHIPLLHWSRIGKKYYWQQEY